MRTNIRPQFRPLMQKLLNNLPLCELEVPSVRDLIADRGHDARGLASFEDDHDCIGLQSHLALPGKSWVCKPWAIAEMPLVIMHMTKVSPRIGLSWLDRIPLEAGMR
jgi:hypothetical protein